MGFLGESAPPASCLGVPIGAGTRSPPEFLGSRWPNPKREFLSFGYFLTTYNLAKKVAG